MSPFLVNASEGIKRVEGASEGIKNKKSGGGDVTFLSFAYYKGEEV